jgi:SAM-dependent methyltransferase
VITELPPAATAQEPPPFAGPDHPMRAVTRQVAFEGGWSPGRAARVAELFDGLAPTWTAEHADPVRLAVLEDALERAPLPDGRCVELGSGTGVGTRLLAARYDRLVAVDLSSSMLAHAPAEVAPRVRADSARLPIRTGAAAVVVLLNMLLFPDEVDRILAPGGVLLWLNTLGAQTPIHLTPDEVVRALGGGWGGVTARAGTGFWFAATRA